MEIKINAQVEPKGPSKKRFKDQEKLMILSEIEAGEDIQEVADRYNLAIGTLKRWQEQREAAKSEEDPLGLRGLENKSCRPRTFGNKLSKTKEERILSCWRESPGLGPSQIHNQLKREGLNASTKAIRRVLIEAGYKKKKKLGMGELIRFEAERPNKLWQMDILDFWLGKSRLYTMLLLDDYSRFVVGWGLFNEATMSHAITVIRKAINRYGKPESILTDKGMQFYSWRTMSRFEKLLESLNIDHIMARAHHPQTLGKIEALNKRIQNELIQKNHFRSQNELSEAIEKWIYDYNMSRTHQGLRDPDLGSVLVPADRYFGRVDEVLAKVRARFGGKRVPPFDYTKKVEEMSPVEILKVLENKGNLEVWFLGRRYELVSN